MIQKHKEKEKEESSLDKLRNKFEQIKNKEVETTPVIQEEYVDTSDREVMLKIKNSFAVASACGCGGGSGDDDFIDIKRLVPYDSPLQDGDVVTEYEESDEIW